MEEIIKFVGFPMRIILESKETAQAFCVRDKSNESNGGIIMLFHPSLIHIDIP